MANRVVYYYLVWIYIVIYSGFSKIVALKFFCRCVFLFVGDDGEPGYSYLYVCVAVFLCVNEYILLWILLLWIWDSVEVMFSSFFCRCVFVFVDMMEGRAGVFGGGHPVIGWHLPRKRSSSLIKSQSGGKVGTKTRLLSVTLRLLSKSRCPGSRLSDNLIRGRWHCWQKWLASATQ